jgi:alanyl-tRNA synthetase
MAADKFSGNEIRSMYLRFFEERGHRIVRSSSLVPANDPTLLFTNAGMNQFKDVFLGVEKRDYKRATTSQKCVRAGGKHNDLENVGFTRRHLTFFEMLGNFSFGDYFKRDAIKFAWELVTGPQWFGLPKEQIYVTIFKGAEGIPRDDEAEKYWLEAGVPKERILELGMKDNFWQMGETGPCGPSSEMIFERAGVKAEDESLPLGEDDAKYVEIWNLVFMQFNRSAITDAAGKTTGYKLDPLPKPSIDTGMGLERITSVLQHKSWIYETDLFTPLIKRAAELTGTAYDIGNPSLRIVADHSRAATFLIGDGVIPSNEGRGYVLRKIIRRALRHARMLNAPSPFLSKMSVAVREEMKDAYPELLDMAARIDRVLDEEENRFERTITTGLKNLQEALEQNEAEAGKILDGRAAFRLYDTYGLPKDFIEDVARDSGFSVDWTAFDAAMEEQRTRAKASWKGSAAQKEVAKPVYTKLRDTFRTEPCFYFGTRGRDARVEAIVTKEGSVKEIPAGAEAELVLDRTTIYAESGGQVADTGALYDNSESLQVAEVRGAYYPVTGLIAHRIVAKEDLRVGDRVATVADAERRQRDMRNHTATHLLNAALRNVLGSHVKQSGSLVAPDHLRFDFTHFAAVDPGELTEIEDQVNEEIRKNLEICTDIMNIDDALASGALAFFGDKYPEANVRVVTIQDANAPRGFYSRELCGGTHVSRTGDIGIFKIIGEQSTAAGVRRIEAISGDRALAEYRDAMQTLRSAAMLLGARDAEIIDAIQRQSDQIKALEKQLEAQKRTQTASQSTGLLDQVKEIKGVKVLAANLGANGADRDSLRQMTDTLRQKLGSGVVVLFAVADDKVAVIAGVTKDLIPKLHAGKIVQELARQVGGSGGGRPDLAEAGGKDTWAVEIALQSVYPLIDRLL